MRNKRHEYNYPALDSIAKCYEARDRMLQRNDFRMATVFEMTAHEAERREARAASR
jgi:hypothetical protein